MMVKMQIMSFKTRFWSKSLTFSLRAWIEPKLRIYWNLKLSLAVLTTVKPRQRDSLWLKTLFEYPVLSQNEIQNLASEV